MLLAFSIFFALAGVVSGWFFVIRPVLRSPDFKSAYERHQNWVAAFCRFRTIAVAKLLGLSAILVELYDWVVPLIAGQDWSPITGRLPGWVWPLLFFFMSALFAWLRKATTEPPAEVAPLLGPAPDPTAISEHEADARANDPAVANIPESKS